MDLATAQQLRYSLKYAGHSAGEQRITLEPRRDGTRLTLEASVDLPLPKTRQRWESDIDSEGLPRRYRERVEGGGTRVMDVEFSREDGLVTVSQGKEDFAIPYLAEMYDPLSLIWAVGDLELGVGEVEVFAMVGGRAYAERLPDQNLLLPWSDGEQPVRVYRLRPGLSLLYFDADGYPVKLTQKIGEHIFEAELMQVQRIEANQRPERPAERQPERQTQGRSRVVSGEPAPKSDGDSSRRRRRRRRYN